MPSKHSLLFHCQHSLGMGHLIRSLTLAAKFAEHFRVLFLNGGPLPNEIQVPQNLELINLPALGMAPDGALTSRTRDRAIHHLRRRRQEIVLDAVRNLEPQVVFIELFPFGRKKFAVELLPLLEEAKNAAGPAPVIICSLRDILVGGRRDQEIHDLRASLLANHYFDAILVHADERFVRLEETFKPRIPLQTPIFYTGFVVPERTYTREQLAQFAQDRRGILVSAGGGIVGGPLLRMGLEAHRRLWPVEQIPMTLVAGPFLPENEWQEIQAAARVPGLTVKRFVPDLQAEMRRAAVSVSQCGYNTTMDILKSRVPAIVVPFYRPGEDEQINRARRLDELGIIRLIEPAQASAARLAAACRRMLNHTPAPVQIDLDGAAAALAIIKRLVADRHRHGGIAKRRPLRRGWLEPVRRALDEAPEAVLFFFRDDDVGWADRRLFQLLGLVEHFALPLDMAVIPAALSPGAADKLRSRIEAAPDRLGLHQHGYQHVNHEPEGRPCEFGASRQLEEIKHDLERGRRILKTLFGELPQPIFTPPWNRCSPATASCLRLLGFRILSREHGARPLGLANLQELPVHIDWFAKKKGVPLTRGQLGEQLAGEVRGGGPVGLMFHHARMDGDEQEAASDLLFLLATHGRAKCRSMMYVAAQAASFAEPFPAFSRGSCL